MGNAILVSVWRTHIYIRGRYHIEINNSVIKESNMNYYYFHDCIIYVLHFCITIQDNLISSMSTLNVIRRNM